MVEAASSSVPSVLQIVTPTHQKKNRSEVIYTSLLMTTVTVSLAVAEMLIGQGRSVSP